MDIKSEFYELISEKVKFNTITCKIDCYFHIMNHCLLFDEILIKHKNKNHVHKYLRCDECLKFFK